MRSRIIGTPEIPRISVFRSNRHIYIQIVDDQSGKTLASIHDLEIKGIKKTKLGTKTQKAAAIGGQLAEIMKKKGIEKVVFDRGGYKYHGRIKAIAEAMRAVGIKV
ncbi:MAG: large subunit ribosomal protein L18 [Parcubacteria group bacterium Licking1014_17]|nr:MAG: large subunit ribosomal protein L18 [Parcubacteria group bacterium Licking1014_17]